MPYYVSAANVTPDEPGPGFYYVREDEDGNEKIVGPFATKAEALDHESDGAYSDYLSQKAEDESYEEAMMNAGRGHLLRRD
jgi:hypothetical protein